MGHLVQIVLERRLKLKLTPLRPLASSYPHPFALDPTARNATQLCSVHTLICCVHGVMELLVFTVRTLHVPGLGGVAVSYG